MGDGAGAVGTRIWTIPNVLSMLRLALVPPFLVLIVLGDYVAALILLIVASLTDLLDGYLARRLGQVTRLGQLLDPAADRLYIFAALVGLAANQLVPWWIVVVIVARDVFLLILGVVLANHGYGPIGWAITLWGAFLYWWAGIIYAIETARVIRIPRVADEPRSDTLEQGG